MNTFTRLRQPATQPNKLVDEERCTQVTPIKTSKELLNTPIRSALLAKINARAKAPEGLYQKYYYHLMETVAEFYQELPGLVPPFNRYGGLLDHALHRCAEMLEERLDHRFPGAEAPQEQVDEEYALWTYMLFTVALMRDIGKLHNCYQVYLCNSEGLMPKRWLPYDGAMNQAGHPYTHYRFKLIDTERVTLDPNQWDKRAGPNLAYKLMDSEPFNWIHGNAAAYRIWWYELGDEEEEGRGGKGTKLALANAEAKVITVAITLTSDVAIAAFIEGAAQEQSQKESNKNLPTLTLDPTKIDTGSATEVTMVVWAAEQVASNGAAASQIQAHNDGSVSVTAAGVEAFAQSFPQLGDAAGVHGALSSSAMNSANTSTASASATATSSASQSTQAQIQQVIQSASQTGSGALSPVAALLTSQAVVATQAQMPMVQQSMGVSARLAR